jgi:hypothetical protein
MGKSAISVDSRSTARWFSKGKSLENIKELLRLPDSFQVDRVEPQKEGNLNVYVSSPDIPETHESDGLHASIDCDYAKGEDGTYLITGIWINPFRFRIECTEPNTALEV